MKPIKNKKHRDPRYFLDESYTKDLREQIPQIIASAHERWGEPATAETENFSNKLMNEIFDQYTEYPAEKLDVLPKFLAARLCMKFESGGRGTCFGRHAGTS